MSMECFFDPNLYNEGKQEFLIYNMYGVCVCVWMFICKAEKYYLEERVISLGLSKISYTPK